MFVERRCCPRQDPASARDGLDFLALPVLAAMAGGGETPRYAELPLDANAASRFLAELNTHHTLLYAVLALVSVALLAFMLSLVTEGLLHVLGYRNKPAVQ